ncbi:MAG: DUF6352 family protein [Methyloversatilis sp.]|nr:DUF6352 family protein [Methyloversatilis sp.]
MTTHRWWPDSLRPLVGRNAAGRLLVTEALLRSWMSRPELALVDDSCVAERALAASLQAAPARIVEHGEIAAIADADARDNWFAYVAFRDRVLAQPDIESAWLELFLDGLSGIAPLFVPQLTEIILHALLEDCDDPLMWRAAELFFRSQRATPRAASLDVLDAANAAELYARAGRRAVLPLNVGQPGLDALCRVMQRWIAHFYGCAVRISPQKDIRDDRWAWHIGLDREAMDLLNTLYEGGELAPDRVARIVALFRLDFVDPQEMRVELRRDGEARPVWMALAMDEAGRVQMKPQNLLLNLPLAAAN